MKRKLKYLLICFQTFLCFDYCYAQNGSSDAGKPTQRQLEKIDSLSRVLKIAKDDTNKVNVLNSLALCYQKNVPEKALDYAQQSLDLAENIGFKKGMSTAFHTLGSIKYYAGDFDMALEFLYKDTAVAAQIGDRAGVGTSYNTIGNIHAQRGEYDKALEYYFKSLTIKEASGDKKGMASCYGNIGNINYFKNNLTKALEFYTKDLEMFKELEDKKGMADSYNNIGLIYASQNDLPKALEFYFKDLDLTQEMGDKEAIADSYGNIGLIHAQQGDVASAFEYYMKSLNMRKEVGDKVGIADSYMNIGNLYMKQHRLKDAKEQLLLSLGISTEINAKPGMMNAYLALATCDSAAGNFNSAYEFHKLYSQTKDSIVNDESNQKIDDLQAKYDSQKKQKEIELLNKDREKQAALAADEATRHFIILISFICGLTAALVFAIVIYRGYRQKQKANLILADKNRIIEEKNKDITDSLNYARRIQNAILVPKEEIAKTLKEFFILFKPKAIVSGDFYYYAEANSKIIIAAVDCTGHGVPGAFMSMIGNDALNEIVIGKRTVVPSEILGKLHDSIRIALKQETLKSDSTDGMDIALCALDPVDHSLQFAGALRNLYIVRKNSGELEEITGDKKSLGGEMSHTKKNFTNKTAQLNQGDTFYIFSDGFADQFGGPFGKKFMMTQFKNLLVSIKDKTMEEQENELNLAIENWKQDQEQIDDILVIGIRV
jgi:serine phosphatase RsbU (regulator of sigma subunit)/Tfp pilus assembly protein PilF